MRSVVCCCLLLSACLPTPSGTARNGDDGGRPQDAGLAVDAGTPTADAGGGEDAGALADGGSSHADAGGNGEDAGNNDSGTPTDVDGGAATDAGPASCSWTVTAEPNALDVAGVGAAQGVEVRDGKVWVYGDAATGVMVELDVSGDTLVPTGRSVAFTMAGVDTVPHPTGLTWMTGVGTFLGNTGKGGGVVIRAVDWSALVGDGVLDDAVFATVTDDLAVNGTRPELVYSGDRWLVATSDYGEVNNAVRLYDPAALGSASQTGDAGVLVDSFPCGTYVQSLLFLPEHSALVLLQNTAYGMGWRITVVDLEASRAIGNAVVLFETVLALPGELEGAHQLPDGRTLFVTSAATQNARFGRIACDP